MQTNGIESSCNPFVLMTDPGAVLSAVARSESLARLRAQVFHPLDKPLLGTLSDEVADYDRRIDRELND
jgi:hypothetical protein